jgi:hypothetical protein
MNAAPGVAQLLVSQLALFLALLLGASAIHKLMDRRRAQRAAHLLSGMPERTVAYAVAVAGLAETVSGALLLTSAHRFAGALLAALVLGCYFALIARAVVQGRRDIDCGCNFGAAGSGAAGPGGGGRGLGGFEVVRGAVLFTFAACVAVSSGAGAGWPPASQLLPACALLALYFALDQVMGLAPLRKGAVL